MRRAGDVPVHPVKPNTIVAGEGDHGKGYQHRNAKGEEQLSGTNTGGLSVYATWVGLICSCSQLGVPPSHQKADTRGGKIVWCTNVDTRFSGDKWPPLTFTCHDWHT